VKVRVLAEAEAEAEAKEAALWYDARQDNGQGLFFILLQLVRSLRLSRALKMEIFARIIVVLLVVVGIWWGIRPRYVFFVKIVKGEVLAVQGKVTPSFLARITELSHLEGVIKGWVGGVQHGQNISLRFSRSIPLSCQQKLRNAWTLVG
jgi:hypothetical protein